MHSAFKIIFSYVVFLQIVTSSLRKPALLIMILHLIFYHWSFEIWSLIMLIPLHTMFWTWLLRIIQIYVFLNSHWSPYGLLIAIEEHSCSFTKKSSLYWALYLQWENKICKTLILLFSICDSLLMVKDLISMFLWPHNLIL